MKHPSENQSQEVLAGLVERVTYDNVENGFCVLRAKARGHRDVVTVVGHAATIAAGEWITASGEWINDRTHGQQFKARFLRTSPPTSADGIEKYLSSGMIRGIGPAYAKKLLRAFGEKVFDIIEATPDRLREVNRIGRVRASRITAAWAEQKAVREIMVFLHSHGVGTARAVRIYKTYGPDAIQVMTENPYRLARDIRGIGFKTADAIAMKLGIEKTAMVRVRAGISYGRWPGLLVLDFRIVQLRSLAVSRRRQQLRLVPLFVGRLPVRRRGCALTAEAVGALTPAELSARIRRP